MSITSKDFDALQPGVAALSNQMAENKRAQQEAALRQFLQQQDNQAKLGQIQASHDADLNSQDAAIQKAQSLREYLSKDSPGHKYNVNVSKEGAAISEADQLPNMHQQQAQAKAETDYSKRLEKYSDVHGALSDLERLTNRDGQGGVLTNPNATLISSGKLSSATPDSAMGLAELLHAVPQGTAEERKAIARVKLSLGHAFTGARMNPAMQKMIQDSLGGIASGDSQLMAKGLRGAAGIVGSQVRTAQSGYDDAVRGAVHDRLGGDPMEFYGSIVKDSPYGAKTTPKAPATTPQSSQSGPHGDAVVQDGVTYKWNPTSGQYE